ncbi:MAG: hypothetical protein AABY42_06955 [Nitrospirota bacterium]
MKKMYVLLVAFIFWVASIVVGSDAMMNAGSGMGMTGSGSMMSNTGSFGMMNGMAGGPVVSSDGTAFLVTYNTTNSAGSTPGSNSFTSTVMAYKPTGESSSITMNGIVSRPVVYGNVMLASSSLPDMSDYSMMSNYSSGTSDNKSTLFIVATPFTSSTVPLAITMDGSYASMPVVSNNYVYVVTSDYGSAMMNGSSTYNNMYGNYNYNSSGDAKTYLYIFTLDGTLKKKYEVQ